MGLADRARVLLGVVVIALLLAAGAQAALFLKFNRASARVGAAVVAYQPDFFTPPRGVLVYLIPVRLPGVTPDSAGGYVLAQPPKHHAFKLGTLGVIAPKRVGIRFRVPSVKPGFYTTAFWCPTCGAGGKGDFFSSAYWGEPWSGHPDAVLRITR